MRPNRCHSMAWDHSQEAHGCMCVIPHGTREQSEGLGDATAGVSLEQVDSKVNAAACPESSWGE